MKTFLYVVILSMFSNNCMVPKVSPFDLSNNAKSLSAFVVYLISFNTLQIESARGLDSNISILPEFTWTFSRELNANIKDTAVVLESQSGEVVPVRSIINQKTLIVYPAQSLSPSTNYKLKLRSGAEGVLSKDGLSLNAEQNYSLTTNTPNYRTFLNGSNSLNSLGGGGNYPDITSHLGLPYLFWTDTFNYNDYYIYGQKYENGNLTSIADDTKTIASDPVARPQQVSLYSDGNFLYVSYLMFSPTKARVNRWDGSKWEAVGADLNPTESAYLPQLLSWKNELYAYINRNVSENGFQTIYKYDGSSWTERNVRSQTSLSYYTNWIVFQEKIYLASMEKGDDSNYHIRLLQFDGNNFISLIENVQNVAFTNSTHDTQYYFDPPNSLSIPSLVVSNNQLYIVWVEGSPSVVRAKVYNGDDSAPSVTSVDNGGLNFDLSQNAYSAHAISYKNRIFVTWSETNGSAEQIRLKVFNGDNLTPTWTFVDGNSISDIGLNYTLGNYAYNPKLGISPEGLLLIWRESDGYNYIRGLRLPF